jgi:hypothetical protein
LSSFEIKFDILCYTDRMTEPNTRWLAWARFLHRWGMEDLAAALLEASGPLNVVTAQMFYIGQPFLSGLFPAGDWPEVARLLESPQDSRHFAAFLRQEDGT